MGAPAGGGLPLPLPGQGLGHLVDHKLHDELLVFILVVPDERHGGAHHLGEEKGRSEERGGKVPGSVTVTKCLKLGDGRAAAKETEIQFAKHQLCSVRKACRLQVPYSWGGGAVATAQSGVPLRARGAKSRPPHPCLGMAPELRGGFCTFELLGKKTKEDFMPCENI